MWPKSHSSRWPGSWVTAAQFAALFEELRAVGRIMSQFDQLIAALTRQHKLILLTADQDFQSVKQVPIENWLWPVGLATPAARFQRANRRVALGTQGGTR